MIECVAETDSARVGKLRWPAARRSQIVDPGNSAPRRISDIKLTFEPIGYSLNRLKCNHDVIATVRDTNNVQPSAKFIFKGTDIDVGTDFAWVTALVSC